MVLLYLLSGASDGDWYHPYFGIRKHQFDSIDLGSGRAYKPMIGMGIEEKNCEN